MAKIKNVVKVMNFHALLNVDKSRKKAEKYKNVGVEITRILSRIFYNKNLVLDKKVLTPDRDKPKLNIYIANDYGFCGSNQGEKYPKNDGVFFSSSDCLYLYGYWSWNDSRCCGCTVSYHFPWRHEVSAVYQYFRIDGSVRWTLRLSFVERRGTAQ